MPAPHCPTAPGRPSRLAVRFVLIRLRMRWNREWVADQVGAELATVLAWEAGRAAIPAAVMAWAERWAAWLRENPPPVQMERRAGLH